MVRSWCAIGYRHATFVGLEWGTVPSLSSNAQCPKCSDRAVESLAHLLMSATEDYYFCGACHYVWIVKRGPGQQAMSLPQPPPPPPKRKAS